jgi:hypothetical protein
MSSGTTVSAHEPDRAARRWEVRDGFNVAAVAYAFSCFTGRVWAISGHEL